MIDAERAISEWESAFRPGTREEALRRSERLALYYDYISMSYQPSTALSASTKLALWLWDEEKLTENDTALDIGCGTGEAAIEFAKRASKVTALDMSEGMLSQGINRAKDLGLSNIEFEKGMWETYTPKQRHSLLFSSMCPAVSTIEELLRFEAASKKTCAIITVGRGVNTGLRSELNKRVATSPLPGMMAEGAYLFNLLYSIGRNPNCKEATAHSALRLKASDAIERYNNYYACYGYDDQASQGRIKDFIESNSEGGIWAEETDAVYMMVYWRSAQAR